MRVRTLWNIIFKCFGLWLIYSCLYIIPHAIELLRYLYNDESEDTSIVIGVNGIVLILYIWLIRLFLVKSNWLVSKLKLDKSFEDELININLSTHTTFILATIIIGGIIFIESLPDFIGSFVHFFQQKSLLKEYNSAHWLLIDFIKTVLGFIMLTNSKPVARYLDKISSR